MKNKDLTNTKKYLALILLILTLGSCGSSDTGKGSAGDQNSNSGNQTDNSPSDGASTSVSGKDLRAVSQRSAGEGSETTEKVERTGEKR